MIKRIIKTVMEFSSILSSTAQYRITSYRINRIEYTKIKTKTTRQFLIAVVVGDGGGSGGGVSVCAVA
jgi:hypothetical protein